MLTDEVEDDAAVGGAAGGVAEERRAVGRPHHGDGDGVHCEGDRLVAGVREGVTEAEDGIVRAPAVIVLRGRNCRSQR